MDAKRTIAVVEDARFLDHVGPAGHPECPERLHAVADALRRYDAARLVPRPASDDEILRVHERPHLDRVQHAVERAPMRLDADTYVSKASLDVALLAAGASIDVALGVARGDYASGIAAVRPPGHHAESDRAMGFCLFNNVAIAARSVQSELGVERIAIVDWDVHHGNGTQRTFEGDASVLYVSTHQYPFYPGTGDVGEIGVGEGEGATLNVPLPAGSGDVEYVGVFERLIAPALATFCPEMILVSAGFDAHAADPLGQMQVSADGFRALAAILRGAADELCGGRVAYVLEGGYSATGLGEGVSAVMDSIVGTAPTGVSQAARNARPDSVLERVSARVRALHERGLLRKKSA